MKISDRGTFSFCSNCPTNGVCCTGNGADMPVLLPHDIKLICDNKGLGESKFVNGNLFSKVHQMKRVNGVCYFYQNNECSIYNVRPLDCRIFPFDLKKNQYGNYDLVVYYTKKICSLSDCTKPYCNDIIDLVNDNREYLLPYLDDYTSSEWCTLLSGVEYCCLLSNIIVVHNMKAALV